MLPDILVGFNFVTLLFLFSVDIGVLVIQLSQISSFFLSPPRPIIYFKKIYVDNKLLNQKLQILMMHSISSGAAVLAMVSKHQLYNWTNT